MARDDDQFPSDKEALAKDIAGRIDGEVPQRTKSRNTHAAKMAGLIGANRYTLVRATNRRTLLVIWAQILIKAKDGDLSAAKLVLEYSVGKPVDVDLQSQIAELTEQYEDLLELLARHEVARDAAKVAG